MLNFHSGMLKFQATIITRSVLTQVQNVLYCVLLKGSCLMRTDCPK